MKEKGAPRSRRKLFLPSWKESVTPTGATFEQFIGFVRDGEALPSRRDLSEYAQWLDEERDGKRYSPATINRKIAAAKSRVRYAFKRSAFADSLRKKNHLEDVLKAVSLKKIDTLAVSSRKALAIEEARKLVGETKDATIRLMVTFLVSTGVRVSEMLGVSALRREVGET